MQNDVPKTGKTLTLEVMKGNGVFNLILFPREPDELQLTITDQSMNILIARLSEMRDGKEQCYDLMAFDLHSNELPIDDEEPCDA
jgi:hypothetical protein